MVHDVIWSKAFPDYKQVRGERRRKGLFTDLCLTCLDKRVQKALGRNLVIEDFRTDVPVNESVFFGFLLAVHDKQWVRKVLTVVAKRTP